MEKNNTCENWSRISENILIQNFPLHRACRDGDVELLSNLLQQKESSINGHICTEDTYYGWTPLHWASYFGKLDCLRLLVSFTDKSAINLKTSRFNQTPAHIAAFAGHPHCLQWLIQAGADANAEDYLGESPLHKSARTGSHQCVLILVNSGANISAKNANGKSSAELAQICRHDVIACDLLTKETQGAVSPFLKFVSSNGYHGFHHPINSASNHPNTESESSMEVEDQPPTPITNGTNGFNGIPKHDKPLQNGFNGTTKSTNGHVNGFHNGFRDVTLCPDVSLNKTPIAGKKRSREEVISEPQMKRVRTEGGAWPRSKISLTSACNRVPFHNISNCNIEEQNRGNAYQLAQKLDVIDEKEFAHQMAEVIKITTSNSTFIDSPQSYLYTCGSHPSNCVSDVVPYPCVNQGNNLELLNGDLQCEYLRQKHGIGFDGDAIITLSNGRYSNRDGTDIAVEILRETHGCETYILLRDAL